MACEALDSLLETLNRILKQPHHPFVSKEIISIRDDALDLQRNLKYIPERKQEQYALESDSTQEIILHLFSKDNPLYGEWMKPTGEYLNQLREASSNFKSTVSQKNIFKSTAAISVSEQDEGAHWIDSVSEQDVVPPPLRTTVRTATMRKDVVVGFDEDMEEIKNWLTSWDQPQLQVLSIVGAGGTGKTTLANLVYYDEWVMEYFEMRAWVTISQDYSVTSILFNILASLEEGGIPVERDGEGEIPTEFIIRRHLNCGRFLIVIDDMCNKKAWDDLKMLFPDSNSGSRIMLTTRLHDVASYVDSSGPVHMMRLLSAHHSWDLLMKKVFVDKLCPLKLEDVGKEIAKKCGGLPLSIVVVAGILAKIPRSRQSWKAIAKKQVKLETVISISYTYLPYYMRKCFIYMGGFPEDYQIRVSELIKFWIAEGFLKGLTRSKSLEEEGEGVLENLLERNLVLVGRRKFDGKIKSCYLHDSVRDFCINQAQKEKLFLSVMDYLPTPILRRHFLPQLLKYYSRISVSSHDLDLKDSRNSSFTHSLICIPRRGYRCESSMHKFSSLRVFHVIRRRDNLEWEPSQFLDLIYLTYLAYNIPTSIVPSTISKLQNLQTLIIYKSEVVLPVEIWTLKQLKHLIALSFNSLPCPLWETFQNHMAFPTDTILHPHRETFLDRMAFKFNPLQATLSLKKLETISLVMDFVCSRMIVRMIPNIKKLEICYIMGQLDIGCLYNLQYLHRLEKLKFTLKMPLDLIEDFPNYRVRARLSDIFPSSLKRLTLCGLGLPWEDMRIIGSLPNLQVLKLRNYACRDDIWETTKGEFGELRRLLIEESNLRFWKADKSNFQRLECLILRHCPSLDNIPSFNFQRLELIEVDYYCSVHLYMTLEKIIKKRRESGHHNFQVHMKRS